MAVIAVIKLDTHWVYLYFFFDQFCATRPNIKICWGDAEIYRMTSDRKFSHVFHNNMSTMITFSGMYEMLHNHHTSHPQEVDICVLVVYRPSILH